MSDRDVRANIGAYHAFTGSPLAPGERELTVDEAFGFLDALLDGLNTTSLSALPKLGAGECDQCGTYWRRRYLLAERELCRGCATSRQNAGRRLTT